MSVIEISLFFRWSLLAFIATFPFNYWFSLRIVRSDIQVAPADSLFGNRYFRIDPPAELGSPGRSSAMSRDRLWLRSSVLVFPGGSLLPRWHDLIMEPRLLGGFCSVVDAQNLWYWILGPKLSDAVVAWDNLQNAKCIPCDEDGKVYLPGSISPFCVR